MFQKQNIWSGQVTPRAANDAGRSTPRQFEKDCADSVKRHEKHVLNDSHVSSSVAVCEIQALKNDLEVLKRAFEEEVQARKTGDARNGEACMQLQVVLEQGGQYPSDSHRFQEHLEANYNALFEEVNDLRLGLEAEVLVRLQGDDKLEKQLAPLHSTHPAEVLHSLRMEIEQEARHQKEEFEHLRNMVTTAMREGSQVRSQDISKKVLDFQADVEKERAERQTENRSLHELINTLADQTDLAIEEEVNRLWEALHTHNHDVIIEGGDIPRHSGNVKVQTSSRQSRLQSPRRPRRIQLHTHSFTSSLTSSHVTSHTPRAAAISPSRHK